MPVETSLPITTDQLIDIVGHGSHLPDSTNAYGGDAPHALAHASSSSQTIADRRVTEYMRQLETSFYNEEASAS